MAFIKRHLPCNGCGSSDALSLNEDGSAYCFSCTTHFKNYDGGDTPELDVYRRNKRMDTVDFDSPQQPYSFNELTDRKISVETCRFYGVKSSLCLDGKTIYKHVYPYYNGHEPTAFKTRKPNKDFTWTGTPSDTGLFGENLFRDGGKTITIVEGECDAMAAYEMLGSKWAVVSVKSASTAVKDVKKSLEFLESYESVVISFDNDKAGKDAAAKVAKLLTPKKAKILSLPEEFKDANDCLKQQRHSIYVSAFWDAKQYTPPGVLNISDQLSKYISLSKDKEPAIPYPWRGLNEKIEGLRERELVTLTGGTGIGKSSVTRELEHWLINNSTSNVGIIALEENWSRTVEGIMSIEANIKLHLDSVKRHYSDEELYNIFEKTFLGNNKDKIWVHAHHGVNDLDDIFSKLRYMIVGLDCKWIILDHLHMLVLNSDVNDERRAIDNIMHRLRTLVEETGCGMILVSHLRRIDGNRGHENGVETGLSHLRGSQSIAQLSDCVISLERNQQADDPIEASTTRVRVLKSRYTGDVGVATHLYYDGETGRLKETYQDELQEELEI